MDVLELGKALAGLSSTALLAVLIVALLRRWLVLPREVDDKNTQYAELLKAKDERIAELKNERDEYRRMAYQALHVGQRAANAVEDTGGRY